jgi:hypothetical protein
VADWRDVMEARADADRARREALDRQDAVPQHADTVQALATCLAGRAICLELRALGTVIDFALRERAS